MECPNSETGQHEIFEYYHINGEDVRIIKHCIKCQQEWEEAS